MYLLISDSFLCQLKSGTDALLTPYQWIFKLKLLYSLSTFMFKNIFFNLFIDILNLMRHQSYLNF